MQLVDSCMEMESNWFCVLVSFKVDFFLFALVYGRVMLFHIPERY